MSVSRFFKSRGLRGGLTGLLAGFFAWSAAASDLSGAWALKAGTTTVYRFDIVKTEKGWSATWVRPTSLRSDGETFSNLSGPVISRKAAKLTVLDQDTLELRFDDPRPNAFPDIFRIKAIDATHASSEYLDLGSEPVTLVRDRTSAGLGAWNPRRTYEVALNRRTNPEMTAIFDADQKVRQSGQMVDPVTMRNEDLKRRRRTGDLINQGALHSGEDFFHAAFVYQHGDMPDDYLKAHILADLAIGRGYSGARWISAATLDRYLQATHHPQVFGTQFIYKNGPQATQDPFNRTFLPDYIRSGMNVPSLAQQQQMQGLAPGFKPK